MAEEPEVVHVTASEDGLVTPEVCGAEGAGETRPTPRIKRSLQPAEDHRQQGLRERAPDRHPL
eukprot:6213610-Alexandrium_andersonii.AAC.1